jgi:hypothetical protein
MAPLKVWQLQDLSLQAAARIMNSPSENRLSVFADLAQNFPSYARTLSKASVPKDLKIEVKKNREAFVHGLSVQVRYVFETLPKLKPLIVVTLGPNICDHINITITLTDAFY